MTVCDIPQLRLFSQHIVASRCRTPLEVVTALGAMQAQDYPGVLWSIALRLSGATQAEVEKAIADRAIVRTWPMRGTLHFVPAVDVRWMLELLTPRLLSRRTSLLKQLELDETVFKRSRKIFSQALEGGRQLPRSDMMELLERNKISTAGIRGYHILWRLANEQLLCFGPHSGRQPSFVLLDEWVPKTRALDREASLAELALRYFTSHGPATLHDFAGWTALTIADAKTAIASIAAQLRRETINGTDYWMSADLPDSPTNSESIHLLPGFDEYLLGYKDRSAVLHPKHAKKIVPGGNAVYLSTLVVNGQVTGTWKRAPDKKNVRITVSHFAKPMKSAKPARHPATPAAERFSKFLGLPVKIR